MNNPNYLSYSCFKYVSNINEKDVFKLGDIVINKDSEIGIVIQIHDLEEVRVDQFGNACISDLRLATDEEILLDSRLTENSVSETEWNFKK